MAKSTFNDIDSYIASFPEETQSVLEKIRQVIKKAVPEATEVISYQIPAFRLNNRIFIFFGGFKDHVSVYPAPRGQKGFEKLEDYKGGKGTVSFSLDKPLPLDLITKIAKFRAGETVTI